MYFIGPVNNSQKDSAMHSNDYKSDGCIKDARHTITISILICMVISFLAYLINSHAIKGLIIEIFKLIIT